MAFPGCSRAVDKDDKVNFHEEFKNWQDIVNFLINKRPFSHLNYDEKIIITKEIKCPTPDLSKTLINIGAAGKPNRSFNTD